MTFNFCEHMQVDNRHRGNK